ncbi:delta-like protein B [Galendromus occidentalis]|uniref:Delta-like protein n=1 Tax=Galendromus occidentalis TaxID=34638 RepID=A0AAJ6QYC0_9ACAR|nr:delta-like protein B [Galendromus occidentalis]
MACLAHFVQRVVIVFALIQTVISTGEFQLKVESLDIGKDLSRRDILVIRICWSHFQREIDADNITCTYGESVSAPLSLPYVADSFKVSMPFDFGWPGTFALVVEAWLESKGPAPAMRLSSSQFLAISQEWSKPEMPQSSVKIAFRAICSTNYYGVACDRLCRPRHDRYGHYECDEQGNKVCSRGWAGEYCDKPVCRPGCKGICSKPFGCDCHFGYEGALCDQCISFPGCKHGSCDQPWQCNCKEGWGGMLCNRDLNFCTNNSPCRNGGICRNSWDGRYSCQCPIGFGGKNCEEVISGCAATPCRNGGRCEESASSSNSTNDYRCRCPPGYSGVHCEFVKETCDNKRCENGATCLNTISGPQCICPKGYEGANCEHKINPCDGSPCLHNGRCTNNEKYFEGAPFKCTCPEGYYGHRCEIVDHCQNNPCANGATCQSHGDSYKCFCRKGFAGANCTTRADHCLLNPCANGGTCYSAQNDFECTCPPGFSGKDCSVNIDECESNPCQNGGRCTDLIDGYKCSCQPPFSGVNCDYSLSYKYGAYGSKFKHIPDIDVVTAAQKATILILGFLLLLCIALGGTAYYRKYRHINNVTARQNEKNAPRTMMNNSIYRGTGGDTLFRNSLRPGDVGSLRYSMNPATMAADSCGVFVRPQPNLPSPGSRAPVDDMKKNNAKVADTHVYATVRDYPDNDPQFARYSNVRSSGLYCSSKVLNTLSREENTYENLKKANTSCSDLNASCSGLKNNNMSVKSNKNNSSISGSSACSSSSSNTKNNNNNNKGASSSKLNTQV